MLKEKEITIEDATRDWVRGFNAIPSSLLEKAYSNNNIDDIVELTTPSIGNYVEVDSLNGDIATLHEINTDENIATIITSNNEKINVDINDIRPYQESFFPMWGTLWTFEEGIDEQWCRDNLFAVSNCGFRIYEDCDSGDIYIGIDGAGYNFYEAHWIPLYKVRGLQWHNCDD